VNVLIVDDDPIALEMLKATVEAPGHSVAVARDGAEAIELLAHRDFQVVISDWNMPKVSGIELVRQIRSRDVDGYIYVLLLTARQSSQSRAEGFAVGADDFINKPFEPEDVLCRLIVAERVLALESRDLTIFAMAKLAESRDPETGAHVERVQAYSHALARQLRAAGVYPAEIDPSFVRLVYETSPLHDIGKVAIPDCVLLKPGRLSDEEFSIMKQHPTFGAETLAAAAQKRPGARFLRVAAEIAASHHERWDGSGYPNRLCGTAIPLAARIVALADVYDAMTSKRVYKQAFTHVMSRSEIIRGRGTHFDPLIVDAFVAIESEFVEIRERFSDYRSIAA
jgi:putative two-component system response regulator